MVKIFRVLNFHPNRQDEKILTANFSQTTVTDYTADASLSM